MRGVSIDSLVLPRHRYQSYIILAGGVQRSLVPDRMAKRIDTVLYTWLVEWLRSRQARIPSFCRPEKAEIFTGKPDMPYLPGRRPLSREMKATLESRFSIELGWLKRDGWLPAELEYLLVEGFQSALSDALNFELPYLMLERVLPKIIRAALEEPDLDLYARQKASIRQILLSPTGLEMVKRKIGAAPDPLSEALETALRGNSFGRVDTLAVVAAGELEQKEYLDRLLSAPLAYYVNDIRQAVEKLTGETPLKIVYFTDNAGESIWDLLLISRLLEEGHHVDIIPKSKPALNDETADGMLEVMAKLYISHPHLRVIPGWDVPGIDLLSLPPDVEIAIKGADLAIVKGEGNFEGLPPDHLYSINILYLLRAKTPGFTRRLPQIGAEPQAGEMFAYFKPRSFSAMRTAL